MPLSIAEFFDRLRDSELLAPEESPKRRGDTFSQIVWRKMLARRATHALQSSASRASRPIAGALQAV